MFETCQTSGPSGCHTCVWKGLTHGKTLFILVLTTVPQHTDQLVVSTKTKVGLITEDDPLLFWATWHTHDSVDPPLVLHHWSQDAAHRTLLAGLFSVKLWHWGSWKLQLHYRLWSTHTSTTRSNTPPPCQCLCQEWYTPLWWFFRKSDSWRTG